MKSSEQGQKVSFCSKSKIFQHAFLCCPWNVICKIFQRKKESLSTCIKINCLQLHPAPYNFFTVKPSKSVKLPNHVSSEDFNFTPYCFLGFSIKVNLTNRKLYGKEFKFTTHLPSTLVSEFLVKRSLSSANDKTFSL